MTQLTKSSRTKLKRQMLKANLYRDVQQSNSPFYAEHQNRLDGVNFKPLRSDEIPTREHKILRRRVTRNDIFTKRYEEQMKEVDADRDMAGLFALERTLVFLSIITATGLSHRDILVFLMCSGVTGLGGNEAADSIGIRYRYLHRSQAKLIERGLLIRVPLSGNAQKDKVKRNGHSARTGLKCTPKGTRLRSDLAKFHTKDFAALFDMLQLHIPHVGVERDDFNAELKLKKDHLRKQLTFDW